MKIQQNWNYSKGFKVFRLTGANGMYKKPMNINMCILLLIVNQEKKMKDWWFWIGKRILLLNYGVFELSKEIWNMWQQTVNWLLGLLKDVCLGV